LVEEEETSSIQSDPKSIWMKIFCIFLLHTPFISKKIVPLHIQPIINGFCMSFEGWCLNLQAIGKDGQQGKKKR